VTSEHSVQFTSGSPETVLDPLAPELAAALQAAWTAPRDRRRAAVAEVATRDPRCLQAWADLAELADDPIEKYAYARVGYHRGLDALRASGWRGSGYVRWRHESNRGFLRSLDALRAAAASIGEVDEEQRCELFLRQLDPEWAAR
jgi:HEAT repeat protein